jgi:hypothetical protein
VVEFFLARGTLYDLVKTESIQVSTLKGKDDIYKTFPRHDISNSFPFCGYHDHIPGATDRYITQGLVLLNKMIKIIPDLPVSPYRVDGKQDDREEFEYSLKKGWTRVGYFQELQPKVQLNGNTAIVTYHNRGTYGDGDNEKTANLKETDVLVKENGKWKMENNSHPRFCHELETKSFSL